MASKIIVVILVAVCALQVANGSLVTDALEAMNSDVNKTATQIKSDFAKFISKAQNVSSTISSKIIEGASSAAESVSSAIKKAEELGANVTACVNTAQNGIKSVVNGSQAGIQVCLANSSASLESDMAEMDNEVESAKNITAQAVSDYNKCGFFGIVCQSHVVAAAGVKGASLAAEVAKNGASIAVDLASAASAFNACSAQVTNAAISNATATYEQEAQCIADKISEVVSS